ncbi:MAG: TIM barrel protein [Clostridiales bacterium]|nr:TIM barrel protein [Clostridiales bacterium]
MSARFGVAGNSEFFTREVSKASADAPAWLRSIGLDAYEYQCGRGVHVKQPMAERIGQNAAAAGIALSVHAPYFINPANPAPESLEKNIGYVLASCQAARWMGAGRIVVHTGALMKRSRAEALATAKKSLTAILAACDRAGYNDLTLCPETMGKVNQLGDLEEVLELCTLDERLLPCVDFGHLYARTAGELDGAEACRAMLDRMAAVLGEDRAAMFHSHFSHIAFTPRGGELRHLTFADSQGFGPDFEPLAEEIARRGWSPTIICESAGTQSEDAVTMKQIYQRKVELL